MATFTRTRRRGLPRSAGGDPWPPGPEALRVESHRPDAIEQTGVHSPEAVIPRAAMMVRRGLPREHDGGSWPPQTFSATPGEPQVLPPANEIAATPPPHATSAPVVLVRRGLPRLKGEAPWPPEDFAAVASTALAPDSPTANGQLVPPARPGPGLAESETRRPTASLREVPTPARRYGRYTIRQWVGGSFVAVAAIVAIGIAVVLGTRWLLSLDVMGDFLTTFPGEYELPEGAPVGFSAWVGWQHFFNTFLIVLIIRSGLQVRREKRPSALWSPRWNRERKISLSLWLHQSLDIVWLVNGLVFAVLLFTTGQWYRIVPSSWEVFPNALSAALQYMSTDWPTENGWVNYNSLQQLTYFATVFVAAPLAAVTGVRMSGVWPSRWKTLSRVYPVEAARRIHFPVMVYFVVFIVLHVTLVFATGALRNLNHMYGAQDEANWVGFWIFAASIVVVAAGCVAARPIVLAPIARLFGSVSAR